MKKILLFALLPLLLISACKKGGNDPMPTVGAAVSEKQLIKTSVILVAGGKTTTTYIYDSQNRVISVRDDSASPDQNDFTYDAAGNIISEVFTRQGNVSMHKISYVNNAPVSETFSSSLLPDDNYAVKFVTDGTKTLSGTYYRVDANGEPVGAAGTSEIFDYQNQNMVKQTSTLPSNPGEVYALHTFEYGNKRNPYLYTGDKWGITSLSFTNKNDMVKDVYSSGNSVMTITYINSYNDQGYPVKVEAKATQVIDGKALPSSQYTRLYTYIDAK